MEIFDGPKASKQFNANNEIAQLAETQSLPLFWTNRKSFPVDVAFYWAARGILHIN